MAGKKIKNTFLNKIATDQARIATSLANICECKKSWQNILYHEKNLLVKRLKPVSTVHDSSKKDSVR